MTEFIGSRAAEWFGDQLVWLLQRAGEMMPEIATLWIVGCAFLLMFTGDAHRWLGRAGAGFFVAMIWRLFM